MTWLGDGHRGAYSWTGLVRRALTGLHRGFTRVILDIQRVVKGCIKGCFQGLSGFANPCTQEVYVRVSVSPPMKLSTETRSPIRVRKFVDFAS